MCSVGDDNFDEPENSKYMVTKCASKMYLGLLQINY